jgi:hypothetical protein
VNPRDPFDRSHPESVFHVLDALEDRLGLTHGFCERLVTEDDWSFLIKLSALLETAITEAVTRKLNRPELEEPFSNVPLGDGQGGKVVFALRLGLLNDDDRRAILHLSRIRNRCAHRVREVNFTLASYVAEDPKPFLRTFADYWTTGFVPQKREEAHKAALENPKAVLWRTGLLIVALLAAQGETEKQRQQAEDLRAQIRSVAAKLAAYVLLAEPGTFTLRTGADVLAMDLGDIGRVVDITPQPEGDPPPGR